VKAQPKAAARRSTETPKNFWATLQPAAAALTVWIRTYAFPHGCAASSGAGSPGVDSIGRIYELMDSQPVRQILRDIARRLKCNKALTSHEDWYVVAIDRH
jgi:hypothetical protein